MADDMNLIFALPDEANMQLPDPGLVNYYKNLKNREFWIDDSIDKDLLELEKLILMWNREDKNKPVHRRKPIRIYFFSNGGSLEVEESICSLIELSKTPIYGIAMGVVASAASLIYLACHKRFALPNAYWIFHQGSMTDLSGTYAEIVAAIEDYQDSIERMKEFYVSHTTFSKEVIEENIQTDWYIHTDEALQNGVADVIVEDISCIL